MRLENARYEKSFGLPSQLYKSTCGEVVFAGRSNVGKSSLINKLCSRRSLARTSSQPGKTATINFYKVDHIRLVDLPGYGYAKLSKTERARLNELIEKYLTDQRDILIIIQLIDSRHAPTKDDIKMMNFYVDSGLPFIIALTKCDKLSAKELTENKNKLKQILCDLSDITVIETSTVSGMGIDKLRAIITDISG